MLETNRSTKAQKCNQEVKAGAWVWAPVMRTLVAEAILGLDTGLFIHFLCGQEPRLTILGHGRRCSECNRLRQTEEVEGEMILAAGVFFHLHSAAITQRAEDFNIKHNSGHHGPSSSFLSGIPHM